jgi:hypothetical protein
VSASPETLTLIRLLKAECEEPIKLSLSAGESWFELRAYDGGKSVGYKLQSLAKEGPSGFTFLLTLVRPDGGIAYQQTEKGESIGWLESRLEELTSAIAGFGFADLESKQIRRLRTSA